MEIVEFEKRWVGTPESGKEVDYIRVDFPGDKTTVVHRRVTDEDKVRWPKHWEAYTNHEDQMSTAEGFPLSGWTGIDVSTVKMLTSNKIYTVEALVDMSDIHIQTLGPGIRELQKRAKLFLDKTNQEKIALKSDVARLENELQEMRKMVESLTAPPKIDKRTKAYKEMKANVETDKERTDSL